MWFLIYKIWRLQYKNVQSEGEMEQMAQIFILIRRKKLLNCNQFPVKKKL